MKSDPPVSGRRAKPSPIPEPVKPATRGLPSVAEARAQRRQWLPGARFWKWSAIFIGAGIILWWKLEQGEINRMRSELLARQRVVREELGPRWFPLRDKIEGWAQECAAPDFKAVEAPELVKSWDFRKMPGIYLRLAQKDAKTVQDIREAATKSLRDAFTSCLLLVPNPNPIAGPPCETTQDCEQSQLCNDYKHCAEYSQPFNLRTAYKTMHVMSDEWTADVQQITNKLTLRGASATFDAANKYDLPVATDLLQRSKYFLIVVDEEEVLDDKAMQTLPEVGDAGVHDDRSIPTAPHKARVCVWRLEDSKKTLALRGDASGMLLRSGQKSLDVESLVAQQRQANSCALALTVREAMGAADGKAPGGSD